MQENNENDTQMEESVSTSVLENTVNQILTMDSQNDNPLDYSVLNNPESEIYKKARERTQMYIDKSLPSSRLKYFRDKTGLTNEDGLDGLVAHLSDTMGTNCIKNFFKFPTIKECELCGCPTDKPLDRAHCNHEGCCRPVLLKRAVKHYYVDSKTPVITGKVMRKFIELHGETPLYMLCKTCHKSYDKNV